MKVGDKVKSYYAGSRRKGIVVAKINHEVLIYQTEQVKKPFYFVVALNGKYNTEYLEGYPFTEFKRPYFNELPKKWKEAILIGEG